MASDLTEKIDGNSPDSIAKFLDAKFNREYYERFDELKKSFPKSNKVIGIVANSFINMMRYNVWLYRLCDIEEDTILVANAQTTFSKKWIKNNIKEVYCAYNKEGSYIGGLE